MAFSNSIGLGYSGLGFRVQGLGLDPELKHGAAVFNLGGRDCKGRCANPMHQQR